MSLIWLCWTCKVDPEEEGGEPEWDFRESVRRGWLDPHVDQSRWVDPRLAEQVEDEDEDEVEEANPNPNPNPNRSPNRQP